MIYDITPRCMFISRNVLHFRFHLFHWFDVNDFETTNLTTELDWLFVSSLLKLDNIVLNLKFKTG